MNKLMSIDQICDQNGQYMTGYMVLRDFCGVKDYKQEVYCWGGDENQDGTENVVEVSLNMYPDGTGSVTRPQLHKEWKFKIRYKNDKFEGTILEAEDVDKPTIASKGVDWDRVNLGKCRHGILCAILSSGKQVNDQTLRQINSLADFAMTGELPE